MHLNKKWIISISIVLIIVLSFGGLFILDRHKTEAFGRSFNAMNDAYKKVLFATGQNQTDSAKLLSDYQATWNLFFNSYKFRPIRPYNTDTEWAKSLNEIDNIVILANTLVSSNQLYLAHLELEKVRSIWQEIFTRNNVTQLGFYLTQYHDTMEIAISQADALDYVALNDTCNKIIPLWQDVTSTPVTLSQSDLIDYNSKLLANSKNIDVLCNAVRLHDETTLKESASKLKGLFIPLYLKYG